MSSISRPAPELPISRFKVRPLDWSQSPTSDAAAFICTMIANYTKPSPSRLRIQIPADLLITEMHSRHALLMRSHDGETLYVFPDFSAVYLSFDDQRTMALYPRPLELHRCLQEKHSSVVIEFQSPQGLLANKTHHTALREDIRATLNAASDDWKAHPEFDPYFREGGCDIPWVSAIATPESYDSFIQDIGEVLQAFEAYTGTRIQGIRGRFRSILPNGEPSPLTIQVAFPDAPHSTHSALQNTLDRWVAAAMDSRAHRQIWVGIDYRGCPIKEGFDIPQIEVTAHETIERLTQIKAIFERAAC